MFSSTPAENRRTLTVRATDTSTNATGDTTADTTLVIIIRRSIIALQSSAGAAITIDENEEAPVAVSTISIADSGVVPAATDPYTIVDIVENPAGFAIDAMGALTAQIDYEALSDAQKNDGIAIIIVGRGTETIGSITLTITVRNTDDEAPVFNAIPTNITVESDATTLNVDPLAVTATDSADGSLGNDAEISYAIVAGDAGGNFAIDTDSGVITVATAPTFAGDATDTRTLTVRATDTSTGATGDTTADTTLVITIMPLNTIELRSSAGTEITVDENNTDPVAVTTISIMNSGVTPAATDPYIIVGAPAGFAIDATGALTAQIDYEALMPTQRIDGITITVVGTGSGTREAGSLVLTITVANIDDEAPVFNMNTIPDDVTANARDRFLNKSLAIRATDDVGRGREIAFSFVAEDSTTTDRIDAFGIHPWGTIYIADRLVISSPRENNIYTLTVRATDKSPGAIGGLTSETPVSIEVVLAPAHADEPIVDGDNDGLIEINTLDDLYNIRYNLAGTSYKDTPSPAIVIGATNGCPLDINCRGYELTRDLDFADPNSYADGTVNSMWRPNSSNPDDATNDGWPPFYGFTATFEGNGFAIRNLYIRNRGNSGLFGIVPNSAVIQNIGEIHGSVYGSFASDESIGILAGDNYGSIIGSHANGTIQGTGGGRNDVGILVGRNHRGGEITSSSANGTVGSTDTAGGGNYAGGLVGWNSGAIISSHASGMVQGGDGNGDYVGGFAGYNDEAGSIIASYAIAPGRAHGGAGSSDNVGGFVGRNEGLIAASYASIDAEAGTPGSNKAFGAFAGRNHGTIAVSYSTGNATKSIGGRIAENSFGRAGGFVGILANNGSLIASYAVGNANASLDAAGGAGQLVGSIISGTIEASYGFGTLAPDNGHTDRNRSRDASNMATVSSAAMLTQANSSTIAANRWSDAVWDFGTSQQYPAIKWVTGYNEDTDAFSCDPSTLPAGEVCGGLLPSQYDSDGDGSRDSSQ